METFREYLKRLSEMSEGIDYVSSKILKDCEDNARAGLKKCVCMVPNLQSEDVTTYLVTVAKLDVSVHALGSHLTQLEISWI